MSPTSGSPIPAEPMVLADHPVLDMLNTVATFDGTPHEFWHDDAAVLCWMRRTGWLEDQALPKADNGALAAAARGLREAVRELVARRKAGERGEPAVLNRYLRAAPSVLQLSWDTPAAPRLLRQRPAQTPEQLLAPLAEAAAELIEHGEFELVRRCEHVDCTLWFYDRTKSHKRRWCSMAVCGTRHKVAEFRKRRQG